MITTHIEIVPVARGGAQVFLRDGQGNFVDRRDLDATFNSYRGSDERVLEAVGDYLKWVRNGEGRGA